MADLREERKGAHFATAVDQPWMLAAAAAMGTGIIGGAHPTQEALGTRLAVDSRFLAGVWEPPNRLTAYSLIYALRGQAVVRIEKSDIRSGRDITVEDLAGEPTSPTGLYVAMLAARPGWRSHALRLAAWHLQTMLSVFPDSPIIFARAATEEGRRLISALGMTLLAPPSEIYSGGTAQLRGVRISPADELPDRRQLVAIHRAIRAANHSGATQERQR